MAEQGELSPKDVEGQAVPPSFHEEMEDLEGSFELIFDSKRHAFGFVIADEQAHDWVLGTLHSRFEEEGEVNVVSHESPQQTLQAVEGILNTGLERGKYTGSNILDLSLMPQDPVQDQIHQSLNMGRNRLIDSAKLTAIIVSPSQFEQYQQLPDLFTNRHFVGRFINKPQENTSRSDILS